MKEYGFARPQWQAYRGIVLLAIIGFCALLVGYLVHTFKGEEFNSVEVSMALVAVGALALGYQQWREAREEASMEKYYEHLDTANKRRECDPNEVHAMMKNSLPELAKVHPAKLMYVYVELDNLEYVAGKYRLGYMRAGQAFRGLRTFQRRCLSPEFRQIARVRVDGGDYHVSTARVVKRVCDEVEKQIAKIAAEESTPKDSRESNKLNNAQAAESAIRQETTPGKT